MRPTDPAVADAERGAFVSQAKERGPKARRHHRPQARGPPVEDDAFTIAEFCARHKFTRQFYYRLKARGLGPREMRLGTRVLITAASAHDWRIARERETAAQTSAGTTEATA